MKISENLQKKEKVLSLRQERGDQLYLNERCISIIKILLENGNINIIDLADVPVNMKCKKKIKVNANF